MEATTTVPAPLVPIARALSLGARIAVVVPLVVTPPGNSRIGLGLDRSFSMCATTRSEESADPPRASARPSAAPPTANEIIANAINDVRRAENCHCMRTPTKQAATCLSSHYRAGRIVKRLTFQSGVSRSCPSVLLLSPVSLAGSGSANARASVAQLEEQLTLNQLVVGSSPTGGTTNNFAADCANQGLACFAYAFI